MCFKTAVRFKSNLSVCKITAHQAIPEVCEVDDDTRRRIIGNDLADQLAKKGAALHPSFGPDY